MSSFSYRPLAHRDQRTRKTGQPTLYKWQIQQKTKQICKSVRIMCSNRIITIKMQFIFTLNGPLYGSFLTNSIRVVHCFQSVVCFVFNLIKRKKNSKLHVTIIRHNLECILLFPSLFLQQKDLNQIFSLFHKLIQIVLL